MSQHIDVFVSSTSDDLREHRAAVKTAIENLGLFPIMMERFPAEGISAVNACKRYIGEAEIYIGLYAHRYGWIPTPQQGGRGQFSITALEYEWAQARGIPCLCFLIDPNHPWPPQYVEGEPGKTLLDQFKQRVSNETIRATFTTPESLAQSVMAALHKAVLDLTGQEPTAGGWRRPIPPLLAHNFVGRALDRADLRALLTAAGDPVVVVRGAGGIGKTYLAMQIAHELADEFPGGVLWAGLGPEATRSESVLASVLPDWVRAHPTGRTMDPTKLTPGLVRSLLSEAPGRLLAVLDDVWEAEPVRELQKILPAGTACLITTRSPRIAALGGHTCPLSKLSEEDGCALLHDRLRTSGADPDPYAGPLGEIVRLLDGHALALDLAARQLAERGPDFAPRFVERLRQHLGGATPFKLLQLGRGETREDSLEAALYLSYEPLSDDAKAKFRALGVLAPDVSFADRTAFAVWGVAPPSPTLPPQGGQGENDTSPLPNPAPLLASPPDPLSQKTGEGEKVEPRPQPLPVHGEGRRGGVEMGGEVDDALEAAEDALAELIRWGLVERLPNASRYTQHMILRTYAAALARRADEFDPVLGRYTQHVIHDLMLQFGTLPLEQWKAQIMPDQEHIHYVGNMLAGYLQAVVLGTTPLEALAQPERDDALIAELTPPAEAADSMTAALLERGENFAAAVRSYIFRRRVGDEGRRWLWMGLACARLRGNKGLEGNILSQLGVWYHSRGHLSAALTYYEAVLPIERELGEHVGEAATINNMAEIHVLTGRIEEAQKLLEQALSIWHKVNNRAGEALTLLWVANIYQRTGRFYEALTLQKQILAIQHEISNRLGEAITLTNIGTAYNALGQRGHALEYYQQALPIHREVGNRAGEADTLNDIGAVYYATGQSGSALEYYQQALLIMREAGNRMGEATTLNNMSFIYGQQGEPRRNVEMLRQVVQIVREIGAPAEEAAALFSLAATLHKPLGQTTEAIELVTRAMAILEQHNLAHAAGGLTIAQCRGFLATMVPTSQSPLDQQQKEGKSRRWWRR